MLPLVPIEHNAQDMTENSPWRKVLSSPTSSAAIQRAVLISAAVLQHNSLPWPFQALSPSARNNLLAVVRALGVKVDGVQTTGWELWQETQDDRTLPIHSNETVHKLVNTAADPDADDSDSSVLSPPVKRRRSVPHTPHVDSEVISPTRHTDIEQRPGAQVQHADTSASKPSQLREAVKEPSAQHLKFAEELNNWARLCPHTPPPTEAVDQIARCTAAAQIIACIVPPDAPPSIRAVILSALTDKVGINFATQLTNVVVIPYLVSLKLPAPRDVMQAIERLATRHWRAVLPVYEHFACEKQPVNGAVAEILVRMASAVDVQGAKSALLTYCKAVWGEDGVRVVEALVCQCKTESGIAEALVMALEKNITGSEKSVRFGKLLFTCVKDVSGIIEQFCEPMRSITARSNVFLAKRALTLLQNSQK